MPIVTDSTGRTEADIAGPRDAGYRRIRGPTVRDAELPIIDMTRVLVTDDNHDHADSLASLLTMMGHEAATAYDGRQAVAAAARIHPEVVILDIHMPNLDGYGAARAMRQVDPDPPPLLVAMTAIGGEVARRQAMEAGFNIHLTKPVDLDSVLAIVEKAAHGH